MIVLDDANLDMVIPATVFGCVGTAGQRCTTTRRLIVHEKVYDKVLERVIKAYKQLENRIGDSLESNTLIGPLHNKIAVAKYKATIAESVVGVKKYLRIRFSSKHKFISGRKNRIRRSSFVGSSRKLCSSDNNYRIGA